MNDRTVTLFEQYDIDIMRTWKGRGAFLCESDKGLLILKEYAGPAEKIVFQDYVLKEIQNYFEHIEQILPTKEGMLFVEDQDKVKYIVKTYYEGKECNQKDFEECKKAMEVLSVFHTASENLIGEEIEKQPVFSLKKEYDKHNRELKKVRKFLREKSQKTEFELFLLKHYDYFLDIALQITEELGYYSYENTEEGILVCHGDYQYHNILETSTGYALVNFEKCIRDDSVRDIYLFMRKLLEKNNWSISLGEMLLASYDGNRPLNDCDYRQLYYRFAYPEKFWKIVNFYYNSGKAWIPGRNLEKLEKLILQEKEKQYFLETIFL